MSPVARDGRCNQPESATQDRERARRNTRITGHDRLPIRFCFAQRTMNARWRRALRPKKPQAI
jgi:hypothetical protein